MSSRLASEKICRLLQHQIGLNKRLLFTNATSWPSHQIRWWRKHGNSRLAVVLLGAAVGTGSAIGKDNKQTNNFIRRWHLFSHWSTYHFFD